jgi:hypothetical protein
MVLKCLSTIARVDFNLVRVAEMQIIQSLMKVSMLTEFEPFLLLFEKFPTDHSEEEPGFIDLCLSYHVKTRTLPDFVKILFDCLQLSTSLSLESISNESPVHHRFQQAFLQSVGLFLTPGQCMPLIRMISEVGLCIHQELRTPAPILASNTRPRHENPLLAMRLIGGIISAFPISLISKNDEDEASLLIRNLSRTFSSELTVVTPGSQAGNLSTAALHLHFSLQSSPFGKKYGIPDVNTVEALLDGCGITRPNSGLYSYEYVGFLFLRYCR